MDPSQMMPRSFPMWAPPPPNSDAMPPPQLPFLPPPNANLAPNRGWKRKNPNPNSSAAYQPPAVGDLQVQNRAKARRWFKPNNSNNPNPNNNNANRRPFFHKPKAKAPRNTTSFIIRAKRAGGIPAQTVSPCPVTPAVLPTPVISPARDEGLLSDVLAQRQWGVDGYGSMKGLIRLRPPANDGLLPPGGGGGGAAASDDEDSSGGSDVEEHVEVERRLDHDLSRFEMVCPQPGAFVFEDDDECDYDGGGQDDDVDVHVARLEEENLTLKERLFLMEQEVGDMRRRLEAIEARFSHGAAAVLGAAAAVAADDDALEQALKNDTEMAAAAGAADGDAVEQALKNDTEMTAAANAADGDAVEQALKNDTEMADNTFEDSTEKADVSDNAIDKSLENGNVEPEKSGEEDRCSAGSEKNAEIGGAVIAQDNGQDSRQA
ncbi:unnamed protein product [Alopecurus aequalis]